MDFFAADGSVIEPELVHSWIGEEDKIRALYRSTLLILPSFSEGIPNVILEAMATKTPIIASPVGGIKEILKNGHNAMFIRPEDPKDISLKILMCLKDKNLRNKISKNAYKEVKKFYDGKIIKKNFSDILSSISNQ